MITRCELGDIYFTTRSMSPCLAWQKALIAFLSTQSLQNFNMFYSFSERHLIILVKPMTCTTRCRRSLPDRFRSLKKTFKTKLNKSVITLQPLPFIKEKLVMLHTRLCILLFCRYQDHPPVFLGFHLGNRLKQVKCMKLSLRWYLINHSEGLYIYFYILSQCLLQVSVNLIDSFSINRGK